MEKPFIQLFRTPNSAYLFDVNRSEIVPISEYIFLYLEKLLYDDTDQINCDLPEIIELKKRGYVSTESHVKGISHPYTKFLKTFLDRKIAKITLCLCQDCNFRCSYCAYAENNNKRQRSHSIQYMTWDTAKKAIDFLWEHSIDSTEINVSGYGGEPLLAFPLLKQIVEYSKKSFEGKKLTFNVTSNTTLFTKEIVEFFRDNDISLLVSLDGPKEINDQNRVFADGSGTYDTVIENIRLIQKIAPEYAKKISINMVMNPLNDFDCMNEIKLSSNELEKIDLQATIVDTSYDDEPLKFSEEYSWKSEYNRFIATLYFFNRISKENVSPISEKDVGRLWDDYEKFNMITPLYRFDVPSGPCVAGQMRLFVSTDGNFYPCERVSEMSEAMRIGSVENGFNIEKAKKLINVAQLTEEACKNCWCFRFCTQCAKYADKNEIDLSAEARLSNCDEIKSSVYYKIYYYLMLREVNKYYSDSVKIAKRGDL